VHQVLTEFLEQHGWGWIALVTVGLALIGLLVGMWFDRDKPPKPDRKWDD
jgi:hypothetical protein